MGIKNLIAQPLQKDLAHKQTFTPEIKLIFQQKQTPCLNLRVF